MNIEDRDQATKPEVEDPKLEVEIGGNRYIVGIHFNSESKENMVDKINRMIRRDILEGAFAGS